MDSIPKPHKPQSRRTSLAWRTFGPVLGGAVFLVALASGLWLIALRVSHDSEKLDLRIGDEVFDLGKAENRARSILEDRAPFFFQDLLTNGTRDLYVNHFGSDPNLGWVAFAARVDGSPRRCTLVFPPGGTEFTDPCTGRTYPATGEGLTNYPVSITARGTVQVDLTPGGAPGGGPSTTAP